MSLGPAPLIQTWVGLCAVPFEPRALPTNPQAPCMVLQRRRNASTGVLKTWKSLRQWWSPSGPPGSSDTPDSAPAPTPQGSRPSDFHLAAYGGASQAPPSTSQGPTVNFGPWFPLPPAPPPPLTCCSYVCPWRRTVSPRGRSLEPGTELWFQIPVFGEIPSGPLPWAGANHPPWVSGFLFNRMKERGM